MDVITVSEKVKVGFLKGRKTLKTLSWKEKHWILIPKMILTKLEIVTGHDVCYENSFLDWGHMSNSETRSESYAYFTRHCAMLSGRNLGWSEKSLQWFL